MKKKDYNSEFWYVDSYTALLKVTRETESQDISFDLFAWSHEDISQAVSYINYTVEKQMRMKLNDRYDAKNHYF